MKILLLSVLFCSLSLGVQSALFLKRQRQILGHDGECYDKVENKFYKKGDEMVWKGKECARIICGSFNGKIYHEIQGCGAVGIPPLGCHTEANPTLPYPDCCQHIVCPNESQDKETDQNSTTSEDGQEWTNSIFTNNNPEENV